MVDCPAPLGSSLSHNFELIVCVGGSLSSADISHCHTSATPLPYLRLFLHPFLIHVHKLSTPNLPIIIPTNVPFSCVFKMCVCAHVCVRLMGLSAVCELPLLDCDTSRAGIVFQLFFMSHPPYRQYASP